MTSSAARRKSRDVRYAGRRAANSPVLRFLARAGLTARGVMYVVIGWIAVQIAFGHSRQRADRTGALHVLGGNRRGEMALWLLVVGFAGLALWRLAEAIYGTPWGRRQDHNPDRLGRQGRHDASSPTEC